MDSIIEELKDILQKVNRYFGLYQYQATTTSGVKFIINYRYTGYFFPDNFIKMLSDLLHSKIYKHQNYYWYFKLDRSVNFSYDNNITNMTLHVNVIIRENIESYLTLLPLELINIISSKMSGTDISNFCNYMRTWNFCDENLYKYLYIENFNEFYDLITPYLHLENINWYYRYTSLLWEEVVTIEQLDMRYKGLNPRSDHINFLLILYRLLYKDPIDVAYIIGIIRRYPELFQYLSKNMDPLRLSKLLSYNSITNLLK